MLLEIGLEWTILKAVLTATADIQQHMPLSYFDCDLMTVATVTVLCCAATAACHGQQHSKPSVFSFC